jgi:uncharacterized protein (DUF433 family)
MIQSDPNIMMGKSAVRGTRITVESILEKLAAGGKVSNNSLVPIHSTYPRIKETVTSHGEF